MRLPIKHIFALNIALIAVAAATAIGAIRMARGTQALRAEVESAEDRLAAAHEKKQELRRRIAEQDAPETVEYQAKAKMNLKNPGEEVVVVVPEPPSAPEPEPAGWWRYLQDFFARMF